MSKEEASTFLQLDQGTQEAAPPVQEAGDEMEDLVSFVTCLEPKGRLEIEEFTWLLKIILCIGLFISLPLSFLSFYVLQFQTLSRTVDVKENCTPCSYWSLHVTVIFLVSIVFLIFTLRELV